MIKDTDDNKIIFNKPQNFTNGKQKIKNDVTSKTITSNGKTIYYACITDITFNNDDDEITLTLQSRDDTTYTITLDAAKLQNETIPSYLAIDTTQPAHLQVIQTIILETMKAFTDDNNTLPEATAINTLQNTITTLEGQISTKNEQIETLNGQIATKNETIETLQGQISELQAQIAALTPTPSEEPTQHENP